MWVVAAAVVGCGPFPPGGKTTDPTGTTPPGTTTPQTTTPPDSSPVADVVLVQALIDGTASPEDAIPAIAWSGGWPVRDGTEAWFVAWSGETPWAVAGDFSDWTELPMTSGPGFSWAKVDLGGNGDASGQRYKLVHAGAWQADPWARSYEYDGYGEISFVQAPADHGRLDRWPGIVGGGLDPRDLRVWVPAGEGPWPVLYVHDGQNLFDPAGIWGGWHLQDALATRDPVLVVGVDNTAARMDEYTHVPDDIGGGYEIGGLGDTYAALIDGEVRSHIVATYGSTGLDGLMGSSLGGLISLVAAEDAPDGWDFAASLSGTLGWGRFGRDNETIEERWLGSLPVGVAVYVDSGGGPGGDGACLDLDGDGFPEDDPDSADNYCETRQFADALAAAGWTWDVDLWHWWEPDAPHQEDAWAERVGMPLDAFLSLR